MRAFKIKCNCFKKQQIYDKTAGFPLQSPKQSISSAKLGQVDLIVKPQASTPGETTENDEKPEQGNKMSFISALQHV